MEMHGVYNGVIDDIKRMRLAHMRYGGEPKKITMSRKTYEEMVMGIRQLMTVREDDYETWTVCGMEIEVRDDVDPSTMFIVS